MPQPIPDHWRTAVLRILRSSDMGRITVGLRAKNEWEALFPHLSFSYEMLDAFSTALSNPGLEGQEVTGMKKPGEVWEFLFKHERKLVYGKINLCSDGKIIIYSAHRPLKGDTL